MNDIFKSLILLFIWEKKKINLLFSIVITIIIFIYVFFALEKEYTANITVLPHSSGISSIGGGFGAISNLMRLGSFGKGLTQEFYIGIISSRRLQFRILMDMFRVIKNGHEKYKTLLSFLKISGENDK